MNMIYALDQIVLTYNFKKSHPFLVRFFMEYIITSRIFRKKDIASFQLK